MLKFLFLFALAAISINGQTMSGGPCPDVKAMTSFNWTAFSGKWYTNARIPNSYDITGKCIVETYSNLPGPNAIMNYSQYDAISQKYFNEVGAISISNTTVGEYKITMPSAQMGQSLVVKIVATDYNNYALAYACYDLFITHLEFVWIKTRSRYVFPWTLDPAYAAYDTLKLNRSLIVPVDAITCPNY